MQFIHPSSIVDDGALVGHGTKIWHWSHISSGAFIGENCVIGQNVFIGKGVRIGDGVKIQNNVSVYEGVEIENDVFCGPSMVFTNVNNPRAFVERKTEFRKTIVRRGASLGANCTIICGVEIGQYSFVGAGALVNENLPEFSVWVGNPSRQIGWMSKNGTKLDLPLTGSGVSRKCIETGEVYILEDNRVYLVS